MGSRVRANEISFSEDYKKALPPGAREYHANDPVWLVVVRGRRGDFHLLALVAIRAKGAEEARARAIALGKAAERPFDRADAVYEFLFHSLPNGSSDFTKLYRRAAKHGVAAIEILGVDEWPPKLA